MLKKNIPANMDLTNFKRIMKSTLKPLSSEKDYIHAWRNMLVNKGVKWKET